MVSVKAIFLGITLLAMAREAQAQDGTESIAVYGSDDFDSYAYGYPTEAPETPSPSTQRPTRTPKPTTPKPTRTPKTTTPKPTRTPKPTTPKSTPSTTTPLLQPLWRRLPQLPPSHLRRRPPPSRRRLLQPLSRRLPLQPLSRRRLLRPPSRRLPLLPPSRRRRPRLRHADDDDAHIDHQGADDDTVHHHQGADDDDARFDHQGADDDDAHIDHQSADHYLEIAFDNDAIVDDAVPDDLVPDKDIFADAVQNYYNPLPHEFQAGLNVHNPKHVVALCHSVQNHYNPVDAPYDGSVQFLPR
ncbi:hypothetical protein SPRG_10987 [Saprolegnia parasitica CBS 223.65]|uniref:Uncharacterized protein n=1 Tax=Saprolegnia parasitica (strain CBS 223.65) TaxID=695850 RepID=A0A067C7C8_SAPPC|nr:hypothetical protein SPRG_10987 [Saprolegnia parasitica CBS 223.65]KDO22672.1 hypothetical protein SPRG_10987 [Saprolegnia parasitica CBS 223.65]|eukprot:XP_012206589.1 hypothetical protein SPRG_10987 [Saprolegnia parasitica CBS 223.65]